MAELRWSRTVERQAFRLPTRAKAELVRALDQLRQYPESGTLINEGRYRGARRVHIDHVWLLVYRVVGAERRCDLITIRDGRRGPI